MGTAEGCGGILQVESRLRLLDTGGRWERNSQDRWKDANFECFKWEPQHLKYIHEKLKSPMGTVFKPMLQDKRKEEFPDAGRNKRARIESGLEDDVAPAYEKEKGELFRCIVQDKVTDSLDFSSKTRKVFVVSWQEIFEFNCLGDPNLICVGEELKIPDEDGVTVAIVCRICKGDSLFAFEMAFRKCRNILQNDLEDANQGKASFEPDEEITDKEPNKLHGSLDYRLSRR